jgi:protein TonB
MFDQLVVSSAGRSRTNKRWTVALSATGQTFLLGLLILAPLVYTEALPNGMLKTMLVAPPPPAAPIPPAVHVARTVRMIPLRNITAPPMIPAHIVTETNEPPVVYVDSLPPGDGGGTGLSSVLGESTLAPPRPEQKPPERIRVGGVIENAMLINRVMPQYPVIAITTHTSGTIKLHAIIAKDGAIEELSYVSGPPLLLKAAMDAVKQWRYRPTLLNGEPVEVETTIDVVFNLGG